MPRLESGSHLRWTLPTAPRYGEAVLDKPKGQGIMGESRGRSGTRGSGCAALRWAHLANNFGANRQQAEPSA